jgi:CHAT domain
MSDDDRQVSMSSSQVRRTCPVLLRVWIKPVAVVLVGAALVFLGARWALCVLGLPSTAALILAGVAGGLYAAFVVAAVVTQLSGRFAGRARLTLLTAIWAAMLGVLAAGVVIGLAGASGAVAAAVGIGVAAAAAPFVYRSTRRGVEVPLSIGRQVESLGEVDEALRTLERQLADPGLPARARPVVQLDRAVALADRAMLADRPDHLDEAVSTLQQHARDLRFPHHHRFRAACELVAARDLQAQRNRDDHGWIEALDLQARIAAEAGAQAWEKARCAHDRGDHQLYQAQEAGPRDPDLPATLLRALHFYQEALRGFGPRSGFAPLLHWKIAQQAFLVACGPGGSRLPALEQEIRGIRDSLRHYRGRRRTGRELVEIALAALLLVQVEQDERLGPSLDEAERLCRAHTGQRPEISAMAHDVLAEALRLRLEFAESPGDRADLGLRRRMVGHLRAAFLAHRELSVTDAADAGRVWAEAAAALADIDHDASAPADAYAALARQVPVETLRRLDEHKRAAFVAARQETATEAGYWLGRADRADDAVRAIEHARAILLGLLTRRLPDDVAVRLRAAKRPDLLSEYQGAIDELHGAERERYARTPHNSDTVPDPARLHRAWGRYDRITDLIDGVVGPGSADGDTVDTVDAARRAAAGGALVYLGAARRGGYALLVPAAGPLRWVPLPAVTPTDLAEQVQSYRTFLAEPKDNTLTTVLGWLWSAVLEPALQPVLEPAGLRPAPPTVTLVPLGELGLLPLHAAGTAHRWVDDHVTVRYSPSARLAARTCADRGATTAGGLGVVSVPAPPPTHGLPPLRYAVTEVAALARIYGVTPHPVANKHEVQTALRSADVWHLACHGRADPADPMASRLVLADGTLTVREIMISVPGTHRLAVLSACESAIPDRSRPDEMIGFPGALLQAGVAGVVAAGWRVRQDAAAALALHFHQLYRAGTPPAEALAATQRWMRTVTRGELAEDLGGRFHPLSGTPDTQLVRWHAQQPFTDPRLWAAFSFTGS